MSNIPEILILILTFNSFGCNSKQHDDKNVCDNYSSKYDSAEVFTSSLINIEDSSKIKHKKTFYDSSIKVNETNIPINKNQYYFPLELFPEKEYYYVGDSNGVQIFDTKIHVGKQDTFIVKWYSEHLYAMREPLLFNIKFDKEIYRFTWLRTFHKPISIRIEKNGSEYFIIWKMCDGMGGYNPGDIIVDKFKKISQYDWSKFMNNLSKTNFWNMSIGNAAFGEDGSEWILEGVEPDRYHIVTMWSPEKGTFYEACIYLLSLTDLVIKENEIY